jgi:hypothetical protein
MRDNTDRPSTLREWYEFSKGASRPGRRRTDFFEALPELTGCAFVAMVNAASQASDGELRPLEMLRGGGREQAPALENLLEEIRLPNGQQERQLQYLIWHRGYLVLPQERIAAREVPCCFQDTRRPAVSDFLVIDERRRVPMLVEVKCGGANDSLSGVLLELMLQWCFHKGAMPGFRKQLRDAGIEIGAEVTQPEAVIAAPLQFYREALRRSQSKKRLNEAAHALRLAHSLQEHTGLRVRNVVISDKWPKQGIGFHCREWRRWAPETRHPLRHS